MQELIFTGIPGRKKAVEALQKMAAPLALVLRSGKTIQVDAKELVPGDIVFLEEGGQVPADIRLLEASQLQAIEASLTGESQGVGKEPGCIDHHQSLGDLSNMLFMGTVISRGHGLGLVVNTGMATELGKIAHMVQNEHAGPSPLQLQLSHLSRWIAILYFVLVGFYLQVPSSVEEILLKCSYQHQPCRKRDSRRSSNNHYFNLGFRCTNNGKKIRPLLGVWPQLKP